MKIVCILCHNRRLTAINSYQYICCTFYMYCARANKLRVFNNMSALTRPRLRGGRAINLQRRSSKRRRVDVKYEDEGSSRDSQMDKVWKPDDWRAQFDNIVAMRRERDAPVDKMGAEKQAGADLSPKVGYD